MIFQEIRDTSLQVFLFLAKRISFLHCRSVAGLGNDLIPVPAAVKQPDHFGCLAHAGDRDRTPRVNADLYRVLVPP